MLNFISRIGAAALLALAIAALPLQASAQTTNTPAVTKKATQKQGDSTAKAKSGHPFHGKLAAVDQTAKTIKIGESTYQITSQTKIMKAGKPATLEDAVLGEEVAGFAKPTEDGKMAATSVRFGPKPGGKATDEGQRQHPEVSRAVGRCLRHAPELPPPPTGLAFGALADVGLRGLRDEQLAAGAG